MKAAAAISTEAIATAGHSQRRAPAPAVPMGRTSLPDADSSRSSSSASFTSAMFWLRRFTSLRRQRAISRSTSGGVVEEISLAGGAPLRRDAPRFGEPHALARDQLIQRLGIHQLHDDVGLPVLLADFMDGDDVGVVQRRSRFGLLHEARAAVGIGTARFSQQFDGDETIQALVPGLVDPTHAALADLFQQGEMPQLAAVHIRSIVVFQLVSGVREAIALGSRRIRKLC